MKLLKFVLCLSLSVMASDVFSQPEAGTTYDKMVDVLSPAPNAAAIIRYGDATLNKNTGTPNVSISLYSLKGTKLGTSVSIGYSSGGIRVDDIASRVGMGWAINAGGVITRTVRGIPDIGNTRSLPTSPIGVNWALWDYMRNIIASANSVSNGKDPEPDLYNYSFDGAGGSFVLNDAMEPLLIEKNGFKVEKDFNANAPWNFRITTTDGIMYLFGGSTATETTKRLNTCGKSFNAYLATAWYLKQIQHPNGEVINFNYTGLNYEYDNGVVQTMYYAWDAIGPCNEQIIPPVTCTNLTRTEGVLLESIVIPNTASITFNYTTRDDCSDKLISSIYYNDAASNAIGHYDLTYTTVTSSATYNNEYRTGNNKTPYLTVLNEKSAGNTFTKTHYFNYIDPEGRPSRLSFSQDHWGFFNGKVNESFTPRIKSLFTGTYIPDAVANREPEFSFAQKGMLQTIVYPTGGTTTFFYEPNKYDPGEGGYYIEHKADCDVTGIDDWSEQSKETYFHLNNPQYIQIRSRCRANGPINFPHNEHVMGKVTLIDMSNNAILYYKELLPGDETDDPLSILTPFGGGDYKLLIQSYGTLVTTFSQVTYKPEYHDLIETEKVVGGVRVAKIATANPGEAPMIKKYFYGPLDDMNHSSLFYMPYPNYWSEIIKDMSCPAHPLGVQNFKYSTLTSSSLVNLNIYNNSLVSYPAIVESIGENFEGGGTESKFNIAYDVNGQLLWGKTIANAPLSNFSALQNNGKPHSETIVKKMANGDLVPIKKTEYTYQRDPAACDTLYGYTLTCPFPETWNPGPDCNTPSCVWFLTAIMSKYNMMKYHIFTNRNNVETTTETNWDENGQNPVVTVTHSYFANAKNNLLTKSEVVNSQGETIRNTLKYTTDYAGTGDYTAMINKNMIAKLVDSKTELITPPSTVTQVSEEKINYAAVGNNNYEPVSVQKSVKGNALETEGTIVSYDAYGHILEYKGKDDVTNSIIWGYNYQYPVAKVTGATYAQATGQLTVSLSALQAMDGQTLRDELHHIRTGLPAALVTTYTYKPLAGISSITDANNNINTYEYDDFNRLALIRDQDGNAVKKNEYVYATPNPATGITFYYNTELTQDINCQCDPGFVGSAVPYTVPEGRYFSTVSQNEADALATAEVSTLGQEYANINGSCSNSADCVDDGHGHKFVSCACEMAEKICEGSTQNQNGTWTSTLHWRWSDGSVSPPFTEINPVCTGVDKKFLDCKCETGVKECAPPNNNGNGTYTATYRYRWSDNSVSQYYTETFACSGPDKKVLNCGCETARKVYIASVQCGKDDTPPCCLEMWKCTYKWVWSDGSESGLLTECMPEPCLPEL